MKGEELKTLKCSNCMAESPAGSKYCKQCGNPLPDNKPNTSSMKSVCPNCYAEFDADINLCKACGTKTKKIVDNSEITTCPRCYSEIESDLMYCPVCSSRINGKGPSDKLCPKCLKEIPPGRPYCLSCGTPADANKSYTTQIREKLKSRRESDREKTKNESFLTHATTRNESTETGDNDLEKEEKIRKHQAHKSPQIIWEEVNYIMGDAKEKDQKPGYLVCNICGDYYELKPGESPDDFIDECSCGGKLIHRIIKGQ